MVSPWSREDDSALSVFDLDVFVDLESFLSLLFDLSDFLLSLSVFDLDGLSFDDDLESFFFLGLEPIVSAAA